MKTWRFEKEKTIGVVCTITEAQVIEYIQVVFGPDYKPGEDELTEIAMHLADFGVGEEEIVYELDDVGDIDERSSET